MNESFITIEVDINPTEDHKKVETAIENLFLFSSLQYKLLTQTRGSLLRVNGRGNEALTKFYKRLREERIITAARRVLIKGICSSSIIFYLNKQAAYMRHISFCESTGEGPLGSIRVEIKANKPIELIDWLAPQIN